MQEGAQGEFILCGPGGGFLRASSGRARDGRLGRGVPGRRIDPAGRGKRLGSTRIQGGEAVSKLPMRTQEWGHGNELPPEKFSWPSFLCPIQAFAT